MRELRLVECPRCRKRVAITMKSTAWCSDRHVSTLMRLVRERG